MRCITSQKTMIMFYKHMTANKYYAINFGYIFNIGF